MEIVQLSFRASGIRNREETEDRLQGYLAALYQNGQIAGDSVARVRGGYLVTVRIPRSDALKPAAANRWVRLALKRVESAGLRSPGLRRLGPDPDSRSPCTCRRRPFLLLFTNFLTDDSPVRCGGCFGPVPLYVLPPTGESGNYHDLLRWQDAYHAMDTLFIGSGPGEIYAHRQMSCVDSVLAKDGRDMAMRLEKKTRRPVYYYLMTYYGSSDARERRRKCPSCKGVWLLASPIHRIFDFQCPRCRLLSNIAFEVRIGAV